MTDKPTRIYFDMEFTGLHQQTQLISIGLVSNDSTEFYGEFGDIDYDNADAWIRENVVPGLHYRGEKAVPEDFCSETRVSGDMESVYMYDRYPVVVEALKKWLGQWSNIVMWSDVLAYDWMLFCEMWGGAINIPSSHISYIPMDLATYLYSMGYDPDVSREGMAGLTELRENNKHNALHDARMIRACVEKLDRERQ